ncbi:MAG: hypothetical protein IPM79_05470 [Polyangiaceae bacterium]|jgi:hypothetical protein|nr:hypothetical protein [Polyangiaceae bacterium]
MRSTQQFLTTSAILASALLSACYPEFQFGGGGAAGEDASTSRGSTSSGMGASGAGGRGGGDGGASMSTTSSSPSNGGAGGISAGDGGAGGAPSTSSTGGAEPTTPCGNGMSVIVDCQAGESCCFSLDSASLDHCEVTDDCGVDFYTFACNTSADCPGEEVCCAVYDDFWLDFLGVVECSASCPSPSLKTCASDADCGGGETCSELISESFAPEYVAAYRVCN